MKKYLLFLAVASLSFSFSAKAQNIIPVPGEDDFEVWSNTPLTSGCKDPNNGNSAIAQWQSVNVLSSPLLGSSPVSVFQDSTTVKTFKYSCKITSVKLSSTSYSYVSAFLPHDTVGVIIGGSIKTSPSPTFKLGLPFSHRISQFGFWYQYAPQMNNGKPDTASCSIGLTHNNGKTNTLGGGQFMLSASGVWVHALVPITYDSATGNPDTIIVIFSSSSLYKPAPGSILWIDGATTPAGIEQLINNNKVIVDVYPNPASTEVNFAITGADAHSIAVYDMTGRKVNTIPVKDNMARTTATGYTAGLYIYEVFDKNGNLMGNGKFNVTR